MKIKTRGFALKNNLLLIALGLIVIVGCLFTAYKYNQVVTENIRLKESISDQTIQSSETVNDISKSDTENQAGSTQEAENKMVQEEVASEPTKQEVVYVPTQQPVLTDPKQRQAEIDEAVRIALAEQNAQNEEMENSPTTNVITETDDVAPEIKITSIRQTAYPDGMGGTYGSYEMEISVTANGGDVLIPMTTSDSIGTGVIGFSYVINSTKSFSGTQESEISNCTRRVENLCKIQEGSTKSVIATVWLTPDVDGSGNYAITFEKINYFFNNELRELEVNRKTATINITY